MKKLFLTLILLFGLMIGTASANPNANVTFQWDANTEADLSGYKLYQLNVSVATLDTDNDGIVTLAELLAGPGVVIENIPAGTETITTLVHDGRWYWVLTAYDTSPYLNESNPSNEVTENIDTSAPGAPTGLTDTVTIIININ